MKVSKDIDFDYFYEFCLDWQMGYISRTQLSEIFKSYGWDFSEFKEKAVKHNYWAESMSVLEGF